MMMQEQKLLEDFRDLNLPNQNFMNVNAPDEAYLANLLVSQEENDLRVEIEEAQMQDELVNSIREKISQGETQDSDLSLRELIQYNIGVSVVSSRLSLIGCPD